MPKSGRIRKRHSRDGSLPVSPHHLDELRRLDVSPGWLDEADEETARMDGENVQIEAAEEADRAGRTLTVRDINAAADRWLAQQRARREPRLTASPAEYYYNLRRSRRSTAR